MEDRNRITRLHTLLVVCLVLFAVLLGRMVYLQLWRGDYYAKQSDGNRLRQSRILAPRGIIYDSEGKELVIQRKTQTTMSLQLFIGLGKI